MSKKSTIMVTGGTGFIGSHLVEHLVDSGFTVIVPYIEIASHSYFARSKLSKKVKLIKANINDRKKILAIVKKYKVAYIFHLAAQTIVTESYKDPYTTLQDNIMGTVNIFEIARTDKAIKGIIFASSDKAYGKTKVTYTEESPLAGDHPYDVSKSAGDLIAGMYFKTYGVPIVTARFGNVYGEGDMHMDRIIPGICDAIIKKKKLLIRSNGKYVRDYVYVKDVVAGYMLLFNKLQQIKGNAYNFSSKDSYSVLELIKIIEEQLSIKIPYKILNNAKNEIPYQHLNDARVRKLGWKSEFTIKKTIGNILSWYHTIV